MTDWLSAWLSDLVIDNLVLYPHTSCYPSTLWAHSLQWHPLPQTSHIHTNLSPTDWLIDWMTDCLIVWFSNSTKFSIQWVCWQHTLTNFQIVFLFPKIAAILNFCFRRHFRPAGHLSNTLCPIFKLFSSFQKWRPFWIFEFWLNLNKRVQTQDTIFLLGRFVFATQKQPLSFASDPLVVIISPDESQWYYGFVMVVVHIRVSVRAVEIFLCSTYNPHFFLHCFYIWRVACYGRASTTLFFWYTLT